MNDTDFDFVLRHLEKVKLIEKKYRPSPESVFAMQSEILAANFIQTADDDAYSRLNEKMDSLFQTHVNNDAMAYLLIKGSLATLREKGITKDNAEDYLVQRISAFEEAARNHNAS